MARLDKVKEVIKDNYEDGRCGLFFTRNLVGDSMTNIYHEEGVDIDICYYWAYFEVFGLNVVEETALRKFYDSLGR